jgi:hypothetical protein
VQENFTINMQLFLQGITFCLFRYLYLFIIFFVNLRGGYTFWLVRVWFVLYCVGLAGVCLRKLS